MRPLWIWRGQHICRRQPVDAMRHVDVDLGAAAHSLLYTEQLLLLGVHT